MKARKQLMRLEYKKLMEETIKNFVQGKITRTLAAQKLGCSKRHISRLRRNYEKLKKASFVHKNRGSISPRKTSAEIIELIVNLFQTKYKDSNYKFFKSRLAKLEGILIGYTTLRLILLEHNLLSSKSQRKTKKKFKKKLMLRLENPTISSLEKEITEKEILKLEKAHSSQNRKESCGERIEMDATSSKWIPTEKWTLHGAIDSATGKIVGLHFEKEETLHGYCTITKQMFLLYGVPKEILTDRRTVFWSPKEKESSKTDSFTQYSFMCNNMGIELKVTSNPQAKGQIERLWNTLQNQLPIDFRINLITNIEQANEFLISFVQEYNQEFAINESSIPYVFHSLSDHDLKNINLILGQREDRTILKGSTIKFYNHFYLPYLGETPIAFAPKSKVAIVKSLDGNEIYANYFSTWYPLVEVKQNSTYRFRHQLTPIADLKKTITLNQIWANTSWINHQEKVKNRVT